MTNNKPTPEELGAYVDGELTPDEAAVVARAIARDQDIANQIACLTRLKAVIPQIVPETPIEIPAKPPTPRLRQSYAAAIVAFAVITGITAFLFLGEKEGSNGWLAAAQGQHDAWVLKSSNENYKPAQPPKLIALASQAYGSGLFFPDLSAARLSLVAANVSGQTNSKTLHLGYVGSRGCRVSLFVLSKPIARTRTLIKNGSIRVATWHHGESGYILMSSGMDPRHFATLAEMLGKLEGLHPFRKPERQILADSRNRARPCQA